MLYDFQSNPLHVAGKYEFLTEMANLGGKSPEMKMKVKKYYAQPSRSKQIGYFGVLLIGSIMMFAFYQVFGAVSGAHINPVFTLLFWMEGAILAPEAVMYVFSQYTGATL